MINFIQVQNKKEQVKKNKMQKCTVWGEKEHINLDVGACDERQKRLMGNKIKAVASPAKFPTSKKATPRELSAPTKQQIEAAMV